MMALKSLFLLLAPLATALVPPCLPELGPQFCPDTAVATNVDILTERTPIAYPDLNHEDLLKNDIFPLLNTTDLEEGLRMFTQPKWQPNRYCMSRFGIVAKNLIGEVVYRLIDAELRLPNDSSFLNSIKYIDNKTPQKSIVFRVMPPAAPFKPGNTIVLGAHMDSINGRPRHNNESADKMIAPGADDNASGTIVLLTVLKALCRLFAEKPVINEVQFHFYGAEEIGLLGSKTVFAAMQNQSFDVKAMLNLDMVGYAGGHESGSPKIALQQGYANKDLTNFVAKLIETYTNAQPDYAICGYPCSDHASAHMNGFPAAMMGESSYLAGTTGKPNGNPNIHTENDTIETLDFDYMLEFAKVAAAYITELAYADFPALEKGTT